MMLLISLSLFLPKILCGFALIHWIWNELNVSSILIKIALGFALGLAGSSSLFFIAMLVGIAPSLYSIVEFWGSLIAAVLFLPGFIFQLKRSWKFSRLSWQDYLSIVVLILGSAILTYAFLLYSRMHPYGFEDAWSIWNYTARFVYRTNTPAMLFNSQIYDRFNPDYPIGLSLNVAWGWFILQRESTTIPIAVAFYIITSPALILWGALKKWRGALPAMLGTLIYLMNPNLKWSVGQMADTLVSLYMLSAIVMLYAYLRSSNPKLLFIAGLLAGFSAWIKNEGILFICIVLLIATIMRIKQMVARNAIKWLVVGIIPPVLVVAAYKLAINTSSYLFSNSNSMTVQILDLQRWRAIGQEFFVNIVNYGNWPISMVFILLVYMILVGMDKAEHQYQIWLLLLILGQLAGYFVIYLITPFDLDWHLSTSIDRVISHLFPLLYFWIFVSTRSTNLTTADSASA